MASNVMSAPTDPHSYTLDTHPVKVFDLHRYLGKWYEIARFDHRFERHLVGVTAEYSLLPDGKVRVVNSGHKHTLDGPYKSIEGKAKIPDPTNPAHLKVAFFLWFYSDYIIMELDKDYRYALVGSTTDKYLWILSRTPHLPPDELNRLLDRATQRGYDVSKLLWIDQKEG